jgi:hypothetical protein
VGNRICQADIALCSISERYSSIGDHILLILFDAHAVPSLYTYDIAHKLLHTLVQIFETLAYFRPTSMTLPNASTRSPAGPSQNIPRHPAPQEALTTHRPEERRTLGAVARKTALNCVNN